MDSSRLPQGLVSRSVAFLDAINTTKTPRMSAEVYTALTPILGEPWATDVLEEVFNGLLRPESSDRVLELTSLGTAEQIPIIKAIREACYLPLKEAKALTDHVAAHGPICIPTSESVPLPTLITLSNKLQALGAQTRLVPPPLPHS